METPKKDDFLQSILITRLDMMRNVLSFRKDTGVSRMTPYNSSSDVSDGGAREYSDRGEYVHYKFFNLFILMLT